MACLSALAQRPQQDILSYVDNLIGTDNGGNVFAGATRPHSLAKAVADVNGQNTGGFATDDTPIIEFSAVHDMGTGGNPSLGNFPVFPELCPRDDINNCVFTKQGRMISYDNTSIVAKSGEFQINLINGIRTRTTVGERTAAFEFVLPNSAVTNGTLYSNESLGPPAPDGDDNIAPLILLDLDDLWSSRQNASITVDPETGRMIGNGTFLPSFGSGSYMMHFCADFASGTRIRDSGVFVNTRAGTEPKRLFVTRGINLFYIRAGGWIRFEPDSSINETTVFVRMGISFISTEQACSNAEQDIPMVSSNESAVATTAFDSVVNETNSLWREKLSIVTIDNGTETDAALLTNFYSALYRTMVNPQNYTQENPLWRSSEPYFDSFYCIWDEFRAVFPLLTIVEPDTMKELLRSLIDTQQHLGWLPDCRMSLCKGFTQGGSNADVVLADAYAKNLTANINWAAALAAVIKDAEEEPLDWSNEGRGGLQSWHNLGYIPYLDYDYLGFGVDAHSVSRTLEYAYNDYCVGTLVKALGSSSNTTYLSRSSNWHNIYKVDQNSSLLGNDTGFIGFFRPRYINGSWAFPDPVACAAITGTFCSLTSDPSETFESSIWEYQFFVPHDVQALIDLLGGRQPFLDRLQYLNDSGLLDISNEPSFLVPFLPHYAARPYLSSIYIHDLVDRNWNASFTGLPGNDDSGTTSAFLVFAMLGLFPNAGQNVYFITAPYFQSWSIINKLTGQTARMEVVNRTFGTGLAIQRVWVNGEVWSKNWIGHELFIEGWLVQIELGVDESTWGQADEDLPPSLSTSSGFAEYPSWY